MPSECSILMRAAPVYERLRKRKLRQSDTVCRCGYMYSVSCVYDSRRLVLFVLVG